QMTIEQRLTHCGTSLPAFAGRSAWLLCVVMLYLDGRPLAAQSQALRQQAQPLFKDGYENYNQPRPNRRVPATHVSPSPGAIAPPMTGASLPQSDQQLWNAARLYEQQGRRPQAQRLRAELQ